MSSVPNPRILLVEDDDDDFFLTRRELVKAGIKEVFHVGDGRSALDYLEGRGAFSKRDIHPLPDIVLIDLKIPEMSGHEVLAWIKSQPPLAKLKTFVLSSSGEERDRERALQAGVRGYFVKPLSSADAATLLKE